MNITVSESKVDKTCIHTCNTLYNYHQILRKDFIQVINFLGNIWQIPF